MNNGFTTTTIAYGPGWGPPDDERVLDLFNDACELLDRDDILWIPSASEVIGLAEVDGGRLLAGVDGGRPRLKLDALADACEDAVSKHIADCTRPGSCGCPDCPDCTCDDCQCDCYIDVEELGDLRQFIEDTDDD